MPTPEPEVRKASMAKDLGTPVDELIAQIGSRHGQEEMKVCAEIWEILKRLGKEDRLRAIDVGLSAVLSFAGASIVGSPTIVQLFMWEHLDDLFRKSLLGVAEGTKMMTELTQEKAIKNTKPKS